MAMAGPKYSKIRPGEGSLGRYGKNRRLPQAGRGARLSDLHLAVGVPPMLRMHGDLMPIKFRDLGDANWRPTSRRS